MNLLKNPFKFFIGALLFTLVSATLTPIAFNKTMSQDPELEKKIADTYGVKLDLSYSGFSITEANKGERKILQNWNFKNQSQKIILNLKRGNISVITHDGENILIEAKASKRTGADFMKLDETPESIILVDSNEVRSVDVKIQLPKNFKGKLDLANIKGDISIKKITAEALSFKTVSSDVSIHDTSIEFIRGANVDGDIKIESLVPLSTEITNVRGDVKIATADRTHTLFTLKSTRGEIENPLSSSQDPKYRIDVSTVNGDIAIE